MNFIDRARHFYSKHERGINTVATVAALAIAALGVRQSWASQMQDASSTSVTGQVEFSPKSKRLCVSYSKEDRDYNGNRITIIDDKGCQVSPARETVPIFDRWDSKDWHKWVYEDMETTDGTTYQVQIDPKAKTDNAFPATHYTGTGITTTSTITRNGGTIEKYTSYAIEDYKPTTK